MKAVLFLALILHVFAVTRRSIGFSISDIKSVADPLFVGAGFDAIAQKTVGKRIRGRKRATRSLPFLGHGIEGLLAVNKLLKGTSQVGTKERNVRVFEKAGDFETAMADFNSLKPWLVTKKSYPGGNRLVTGLVGNRLVVVDKIGHKRNPTTTVLRESADGVYDSADRIIYYKDTM